MRSGDAKESLCANDYSYGGVASANPSSPPVQSRRKNALTGPFGPATLFALQDSVAQARVRAGDRDKHEAMSDYRVDLRTIPTHVTWLQVVLAALLACGLLLPAVQPLAAQEPAPAAALHVANGAGGVQIVWGGAPAVTAAGTDGLIDALAVQLPLQRYQGYDLPLKVVPLRFSGPDAVMLPQITRLETIDLPAGLVVPGAPEEPPVILEEGQEPPVATETVALPEQPIFVLRQGVVKGEYLVMVAISPIFAQGGVTKLATVLETSIPGANAILETPWEYGESRAAVIDAADAAQPTYEPAVDAAAVDAATATVTLVVANPGIQVVKIGVPGSLLPAAYKQASLATVRLTNRGVVVPVQVVGDELRFYVESVGDRWNTSSYFQVSLENEPARRSPPMATRPLAAPGAGGISTVIDRGEWKDQYSLSKSDASKYSSNYAGADGDHYYSALFSTEAGDAAPGLTANLRDVARILPPNTLPLVNATSAYTFTATPVAGKEFTFTVAGQPVRLEATTGPVSVAFNLATNPDAMTVTFVPQDATRTLQFESISYARPVALSMGNSGALFWGNPGDTTYRWSNAPQFAGGYGVWDVTDPANPVALTGAGAAGFQDSEAGHRYLVAGEGFVHAPTVRAYSPVYARGLPAAHAIYIIPGAEYAAPLKPLTDLRVKQGYTVRVVDVTRIYDGYSGGYVDPAAIRSFLKDAYSTWKNPKPVSVVLVGDGTYDPKNYEKKDRTPALIPPYMKEGIDRWLGEAACDNCYGHFDDGATLFAMDLMVGRFPIKDAPELALIVGKIVSYETATDVMAPWRNTTLYLADNYLKPSATTSSCLTGCRDSAGNFAAHSDAVRSLNPNRDNTNLTPRVYYDPFPLYQTPPAQNDWWRVVDRDQARARALAGLQDGPALVVYNGHANLWNMGELEKAGTSDRVFMLSLNDPFTLYKPNQLFVQLSMTCLTAAFATPANSGTTIDEAFFLAQRGGAVAVWGSSGLSLVEGHEALQVGFFGKLFAKPGTAVRLGDLLDAGYLNLSLSAPGNEDILQSFMLLGDPLTRLNYAEGPHQTYIPVVNK